MEEQEHATVMLKFAFSKGYTKANKQRVRIPTYAINITQLQLRVIFSKKMKGKKKLQKVL